MRVADSKTSENVFRTLTLKYVIGLVTISVMGLALFVAAELFATSCSVQFNEFYYTSTVMAYTRRVHIEAREWQVLPKANLDSQRFVLNTYITGLLANSIAFRFGNGTTGLTGFNHKYVDSTGNETD